MIDIEKRLRRAFSSMAANESLADGLTEDAAASMLKWGEVIAEQLVLRTNQMEDSVADEFLAPYSSALRKMMRAIGHWVVETDETVRSEWWNRIEQMARLYMVIALCCRRWKQCCPSCHLRLIRT